MLMLNTARTTSAMRNLCHPRLNAQMSREHVTDCMIVSGENAGLRILQNTPGVLPA